MPKTDFIAIGSIIIDDIVYPDGRTSMGVLGGGGTHAAYGIAFTGERTGLVGLVGDNLPADIRERLSNDFDISGLSWSPHPQLRGWQIFEWDGVRNEVFRVEVIDPFVDRPFADSADIPFSQRPRLDAPARTGIRRRLASTLPQRHTALGADPRLHAQRRARAFRQRHPRRRYRLAQSARGADDVRP